MRGLTPTLFIDWYKFSHTAQIPEGTEYIMSTWTPRGSRIEGITEMVTFGNQGFCMDWLIDYFDVNFFDIPLEMVLAQSREAVQGGLMIDDPDLSHVEELHDLGYLPLLIKAIPEGRSVPMRVPTFTVENSHPMFAWLVGSIESFLSCETWLPNTLATIAKEFRTILDYYAMATTGSTEGVDFQAHDFSFRGLPGINMAAKAGAGHLIPFLGTDNVPAMFYMKDNYGGKMAGMGIGGSIPATEHMIQCLNMPEDRDETPTIRRLITEVYPGGLLSIVMDTYDFWDNVTRVLPSLREEIMAREGKLVVRPDSGDPVDIVCGTADVMEVHNSITDPAEIVKEMLVDSVDQETPHGEYGAADVEGYFRDEEGRIFHIVVDIEWDRHDKQYYYISDSEIRFVEEVELTAEQKGLVEVLYEQFGGTTNDKGFKVLDDHIGAIYGDSITLERCREICEKLSAKGFASTNIVLGIGSFSYTYHTRDTFCQAFKSPWCMIDGEEKFLSKDPKTDNGTKKSQRGRVVVIEDPVDGMSLIEGLTLAEADTLADVDLLVPVFRNSEMLVEYTLDDLRENIRK
ncbi:MAG: nicotinate phosphoribosyltransferase [Desulfobulbaceae bacterium]|nr:nicotinate phosphoribosyltransferase [Desulfobulbaceae bacterium]